MVQFSRLIGALSGRWKPMVFVLGLTRWRKTLRTYFPDRNFIFLDDCLNEAHVTAEIGRAAGKQRDAEIWVWRGMAPTGLEEWARQRKMTLRYLESGPFDATAPAERAARSLTLDSGAPYTDATRASDLEVLLGTRDFDAELMTRAARCAAMLCGATPEEATAARPQTGDGPVRRVLVIGEHDGGPGVVSAGRPAMAAVDLVRLAMQENPGAEVLYRPAPGKAGSPDGLCPVVPTDAPLADILRSVGRVYAVAAPEGLLAALCGAPVTVLGTPFYAGWGFTEDRQPLPRRTRRLTPLQVFAGAYLLHARYFDPDTGSETTLERVAPTASIPSVRTAAMPTTAAATPVPVRRTVILAGSGVNKGLATIFAEDETVWLDPADSALETTLVRRLKGVTSGRVVLPTDLAGSKQRTARRIAQAQGAAVVYLEAGFLRGADRVAPPVSWLIDPMAPHWDGRVETRLEWLLANHDFEADSDLMARAAALKARLLDAALTRTNDLEPVADLAAVYGPKQVPRVLVLGALGGMESNAGANPRSFSNLDLVQIALREHPSAQIVYRPHPLGGERERAETAVIARACPDVAIPHALPPLPQALETVDRVITVASLGGFEATLRGIPVTTFGAPFYAGWGATDDRAAPARRVRRLTLDQVFAAAYLLYPRYVDPLYRTATTAEDAVAAILAARASRHARGERRQGIEVVRTARSILGKGLVEEGTTLLSQHEHLIGGDAEALTLLHAAKLKARDYAGALQTANDLVELTPSSSALLARARSRLRMGDFGPATAADFRKAMELDTGIGTAHYEYYRYLWEREPVSQKTMADLGDLMTGRNLKNHPEVVPRLMLLYAGMLAEVGSHTHAVSMLDRALKAKANAGQYLYLRYVAHLTRGSGYVSAYEKENFQRLLAQRETFNRMIEEHAPSICVVGNGPGALGSGTGRLIDEHEVVIRFNSYATTFPHAVDYGTKTDIWVRMPFDPYVRPRSITGVSLILFTGSNRPYRPYSEWQAALHLVASGATVGFFDPDDIYTLQEQLGGPPTAGLATVHALFRRLGHVDPSKLFGLSFAEEGAQAVGSYHYADSRAAMSARHDWDREAAVFADMAARSRPEEASALRAAKRARTQIPATWRPESTTRPEAAFDLVVSVSPGLGEYRIFDRDVTLLSRGEVEAHLLHEHGGGGGRVSPPLRAVADGARACFLGFGLARTGHLARELADRYQCAYRLVEYGLISSMHLPSERQFNFSLILDCKGIFYDTTSPSEIEDILLESPTIREDAVRARARRLIDQVCAHNITKYNNSPDIVLPLRQPGRRRVLVVDQTAGDNSIVYGQCSRYSFDDMLAAALADPDAEVLVKVHPESVVGAKPGNYDVASLRAMDRVTVIAEQINIMSLIKQVDAVFVMTSGVGLEAILLGKPVSCFGVPFYAGWGLTRDMTPVINRRRPLSVEELFAGVFFEYTHFFHPETKAPTDMETVIDWIVARKAIQTAPGGAAMAAAP